MNFKEMQRKLAAGRYASFEPFEADFRLICSNCMVYNKPDTIYYKEAAKLLTFGLDRIAVVKAKWEGACAAAALAEGPSPLANQVLMRGVLPIPPGEAH